MNLKLNLILALALILPAIGNAQNGHDPERNQNWRIQSVPIQTRWAKLVSPVNALKEYPRPQMVRAGWTNLNGLWDYAITAKNAGMPTAFGGKILVPYPLESALSGVKKALKPEELLWYKREFTIDPSSLRSLGMTKGAGKKTLLHFGAVDYQCWVYVNGKEVGTHEGGYTEFSFDVTSFLNQGSNELVVKVYDPSDAGIGPRGKQVLNPQNIYYTPSSGIWQTVWMEAVPEQHIEGLVMTPDVDKGVLNLEVKGKGKVIVTVPGCSECGVLKQVQDDDRVNIVLRVPNAKLWSPTNPFLYDITLKMGDDVVKSYFGMRKISVAKDGKGVDRIFLNNKPYFNLGTLDQGFWPDGLHTAPTDEALAFDIKASKAMGFNTIRKHIKIEPARWYYHADKIGMLVWQDFVQPNPDLPAGAKEIFEKQGAEMMAQLHNHPSITTWVLFNEKWGQYDQERLTKWVKQSDPSRLVNGHSGEFLYVNEKLRSPSPNAYVGADMTDVHSYPDPMNAVRQDGKARVLGEFGGIGVFIPDHQWLTGSAWGYIQEKPAALAAKYRIMNQHLQLLEKEGLSASIYTQPFDVEGEQNGLMTYDREVVKVPFGELREIHGGLNGEVATPKWLAMTGDVAAKNADLTEPAKVYAGMVQEYIAGKRDAAFLKKLAMMAGQVSDLAGKARFGNEYMETLKEPYSEGDLLFIDGMTKKVTDKGFTLLMEKAKADRAAYVKVMNIVYADVIQPFVPTSDVNPDWSALEQAIKPYGLPGEEIYLRAKTIHLLNQQDWTAYLPAVRTYLEKFSSNISEKDKEVFQKAIDEHQ
jgi:hypothetical protein